MFGNVGNTGGGFTFGVQTTQGTASTTGTTGLGGFGTLPKPGGFSFGANTQPAAQPGLQLGTNAAASAAGGFQFGAPAPATGTSAGGFQLGTAPNATATANAGGFQLGNMPTASSTGGFQLGTAPTATATGGFQLGTTSAATPATGGFQLGVASTAAPAGGLQLGVTPTANTQGGFNFATGTTSTAPAVGSSLLAQALGSATTTTTAAGLGTTPSTGPSLLGAAPTLGTTASTSGGFSLGGTSTAPTGGFSFGGSAPTSGGLSLGGGLGGAAKTTAGLTLGSTTTATTSAGGSFGLLGGIKPATTTTTTGVLGGFGLAKPTGIAATGTGSVFGNVTTKPQTTGLGGVDPKTSQVTSGGTTTDAKPGDAKTLKESQLPPEIITTVDEFQKYVKDEKSVQDNLARMSSKPMYKVQEDVAALRQLLSVVSNGIQRNTCAVEKLKREMTQELKNAEMAQRTKDIPPGLQYENTAPTEYFQKLVEDFEHQMLSYRQQIETLEGHLASLHQPNKLSAEELIGLMRKLHEAFVALASQLHHVHEAVKTQKEHFLNYRKIFLHDTKDIFDREKKATSHAKHQTVTNLGPSPFTGMSNAAAIAMASALSRSQQPTGGPPVAGLVGANTLGGVGGTSLFGATTTAGIGFGSTTTTPQSTGFTGFGVSTTTTQSTGFGGTTTFGGGGSTFGNTSFGGFGTSGGTATVRPLGFGAGNQGTTGLFGGGTTGFNLNATQQSSTFGGLGTTTPAFGVANPTPDTPFQLNKPPPPGSKRGKR